LRKLCEI